MAENIKLSCGGYKAEVQLKGAQIASLKTPDGREVIWQADPAVWPQHAPVLFPVCGSVVEDSVIIDDVRYPMKKHGFTREPSFEICRVGDDFVELVLAANDTTRASFPFDFRFHVTYSLFEGGYTTTFLVENRSDKVMPFCVGGHPGYICPMESGAKFTDYQLVFEKKETGENSLCPGGGLMDGTEMLPLQDGRVLPMKHELFDTRDALIFTTLNSRCVDLVNKNSGHGLRFAFPKMEVLAVWSKPGANADYICLEPWHGQPASVTESGKFEDKPHVTLLAPGRCYKTWFTTTLI